MEVRIVVSNSNFSNYLIYSYFLLGTRSVVLLARPLKKMHSSRIKKCGKIGEEGEYEGN